MRDHSIQEHEITVGRNVGPGEDVLRVEDVQALVLHGPHVEVSDGDDHVLIQVKFQPEAFFVPGHRTFECFHREAGLVKFSRLDINRQGNFLS